MPEQPSFSADPMLDDDDVEGHGMRELAVGLGAAAVVGAGGAATAFAVAPPGPPHPVGPTVASMVQAKTAQDAGSVQRAVDHVVRSTQQQGGPTTQHASTADEPATTRAETPGASVGNPASIAHRDVSKVGGTVGTVKAVVGSTVGSGASAKSDVLQEVDRAVQGLAGPEGPVL
ncbi:MAG TPA: hypothetical protein VHE83_05925 [Mycobacteriales bacterium]|nr:hypothetical protein [Mycobacteriales bacterium]